MNPERWQQIETLYHAALERESGACGMLLDQACAGDEKLRREVEVLLRYDGSGVLHRRERPGGGGAGVSSRRSEHDQNQSRNDRIHE